MISSKGTFHKQKVWKMYGLNICDRKQYQYSALNEQIDLF